MTTALLTIEDAYKVISYLALPESWHQLTIVKVTQARSPELVGQIKRCLEILDKVSAAKLEAINNPNYGLVQADVLRWQPGAKDTALVNLEEQAKTTLRQLLDLGRGYGQPVKPSYSVSVQTEIIL